MRFSYPIKRIDSLESFSRLSRSQSGGNFPIGSSLTWHGGIHIETEDHISCIADGTIVAYRFSQDYKSYKKEDKDILFSNNFVLVQHHYKSPKEQELIFYSLYQHLQPRNGEFVIIPPFLSETADDGTTTWRADAVSKDVKNCNIPVQAGEILGYGGYSGVGENNPKLVHLEVFTAAEEETNLNNFIKNEENDGISECGERISNPHAFLPARLRESFPCRLLGDTQITDVSEYENHYRIKIGSVRRWIVARQGDLGPLTHDGRNPVTNEWINPRFSFTNNIDIFGGLPQQGDFIRLLEPKTQAEINAKRDRGDYSLLVEYEYPNITGRTFFIEKKYLEKIEIEVPDNSLERTLFKTLGPWLYLNQAKSVNPAFYPERTVRTETHYRLPLSLGTSVVVQDLHLRVPSDDRVTDVGENSVVVQISPENTVTPPGGSKPWYYKRPSYVYNNAKERNWVEGYFQVDADRVFPAHNWHNFGFRISKIDQDKYRMDLENPSPLLQKVWSIIKNNDEEEMPSNFWFTHRLKDDRHIFALSRHIFLHRNDWVYDTNNDIKANLEKEWKDAMDKFIRKYAKNAASKDLLEKQRDERLKLLINLVVELSFWNKIKIDTTSQQEGETPLAEFPTEPYVYHFHPIAFIEQMMKMTPKWFEPVANPQINKFNSNGAVSPRSATFGDTRRSTDGTRRFHSGLDLFALPGTKVYACLDGTIVGYNSNINSSAGITLRIKVNNTKEFINRVREVGYKLQFADEEMGVDIKETDSVYLIYMHLKESFYKETDVNKTKVEAGTHIGYSGVTGSTATGTRAPHLHFEIATVVDAFGRGRSVRTNPARVVELQPYDTIEQDKAAKYKHHKDGTKTKP